MHRALAAADEIYNVALQILNNYGVDAKAVPLVMGTVTQRIETFATGAMAREMAALRKTDTEEVDDGGHIA